MRRMAEEQLPNLNTLIDALRTRLHDELDGQLRAMADSHARGIELARQAADAEAEDRCTARLEIVRGEWNTRLEAAVSNARAEAERIASAEIIRVRAEGEQAAREAADAARREVDQAFAAEREQLQAQLEAERLRASAFEADSRRAAALQADLQRTAADLDAQHQRVAELEADRHRSAGELETERQRVTELQAVHQRLTDLDAERERSLIEMAAERHRIAELETQSQRIAADLAAEREQLKAQLEEERQRAAALVREAREQAEAQLAEERERGLKSLLEARSAFESERTTEAALSAVEPAAVARSTSRLVDAIRAVDEATSLTGVLAAAVRGAAAEAPRAAMFLVQGTELREWPVAGVASVDSSPLRADGREAGIIADALRQKGPAMTGGSNAGASPFFASLPPGGVAIAVPLMLAGTPVAVLYADERGDAAHTDSWQESVQILGRHAAACAASLTARRTAQAQRFMAGGPPAHGSSASDPGDEVHAARRYARLLVSEIKLYNESAVRTGRERRDLLRRLEPEIDRARRLYDERVAPTVQGRDSLFDQELAQTLADGDQSLLGAQEHQRSSWS
jgi:hypothetical protein